MWTFQTRRDLLGLILLAASGAPVAAAPQKPKIGIIGAGRVGGVLAKLWAGAGYRVMLSARNLDPVRQLAAQIGPNAQAGTPAEAAAFGDVVVVSVPYGALPQIGRDYAGALKGKVVLDTCNPVVQRDGPMAQEALDKGTGVMDPLYLPGTRLVRAFSTINYVPLEHEAHRAGEPIGIPLAGNDRQALEVASQLVRDAGFEPVVVGDLSTAKSFDIGQKGSKVHPVSELRAILEIK
ncbi:MAG TPA: NAD(P)-binding domain-containing protein [Rhizomicrobium sp.]|nr:NAD(P)-binding domain-containing protein [Rhizomicrobium sp.]